MLCAWFDPHVRVRVRVRIRGRVRVRVEDGPCSQGLGVGSRLYRLLALTPVSALTAILIEL